MPKEEVFELLEPEVTEKIYGRSGLSEGIVSLLNRLNRAGWTDARLAEFFNVAKSSISKWRSGKNTPSAQRMEELKKLLAEASGNIQATSGNGKHPKRRLI